MVGMLAIFMTVLLSAFFISKSLPVFVREGAFLPKVESNRGKNLKNRRTFSQMLRNVRNSGGSIHFVFGFSTGHVGTTTFTSPASYNPVDLAANNVYLMFERGGVPTNTYKRPSWTLEMEIMHVEYYYGPELLGNLTHKEKMVRVDLSHVNLYFYRGLLHVLESNNASYTFVRILRNRHELAVSMSVERKASVDFFARDYYRYEPFEAPNRVILKVPNGNTTWNQFSMQQKVLWVIDETQAHWESLIREFPRCNYIIVNWSKSDDNIGQAVANISRVFGVRPSAFLPHTKVHAGQRSSSGEMKSQVIPQDTLYKEAMKYNSSRLDGFGSFVFL